MRVLRLALGVFIIVQGFMTHDWLFVILGSLFSLMPLLNIGCCGTRSCSAPVSKSGKQTDFIHFEEVKQNP